MVDVSKLLQPQNLRPIAAEPIQPKPAAAGQAAGTRGYVGVHNLHKGEQFASMFQHVSPSNEQLLERLGPKALKYISLDRDAQGDPSVKLRLKNATTERAAAANAKAVQAEYAAARDALWQTTKAFDEELKLVQGQERNRDLAKAPFYARWFGKIRDFIKGEPPPVSLTIQFKPGQVDAKQYRQGQLVVATTDEAGRLMAQEALQHAAQANAAQAPLIQGNAQAGANPAIAQAPGADGAPGAAVPPGGGAAVNPAPEGDDAQGIKSVAARKQKAEGYDNKHGASKAAWVTGGVVIGGAGVGLMVTAGTVATAAGAALLAPVVLAGGALLVAAVGLKAAFGTSPWWGKTATGQLQHAERQQARELAGTVAEAVKQQVLRGSKASNVEVPAGQLHKRFLVDDPKAVSDFVRLAREKNHDGLKALVKERLQDEGNSFLTEKTIKNSKIGWLRGLWPPFSGNEAAHARKTMDIAVREIVRGIEQGVAEGVLQTVVGEMIDERSVQAEKAINEAVKPRFDDFQNAVRQLEPRGGDDFYEIFEVDQHLAALQRLRNQVDGHGQALSPTKEAVKALADKHEAIGDANLASYRDALLKLDHDIQAHIGSLGDARRLLRAPAALAAGQPAVQDDGQHLEGTLRGISAALSDVQEADVAAVGARYDDLAASLRSLRARLANSDETPKLIQAHAQKLEGLFTKCEEALTEARKVSEGLSGAHQALRQGSLTLAQVNATLGNLNKLNQSALRADMDPTKTGEINQPIRKAQDETKRLIDLCDGLNEAQQCSQRLAQLGQSVRDTAQREGLDKALGSEHFRKFATEIQSQQKYLKEWTDAGFSRPQELKEWGSADLEQLRVEITADVLGLNQAQAQGVRPLLEHLVKAGADSVRPLIDMGRLEGGMALLQSLNGHLPPADPTSQQAQVAALACHAAALDTLVQVGANNSDLLPLVQSLHPHQTELLQKQQRALEADQALWIAFHGEGGNAIEAWVEDQGLVNLPPLQDGAGNLQPFNAQRKFAALEAFIEAQPNLMGAADMLQTLQGARGAWNVERRFKEQTPEQQQAGLIGVQSEALRQLKGVLEALQPQVSSAVEQLRTRRREQELQAQALARAAAEEIVPGKGHDANAVRDAVRQDLQPKSAQASQRLDHEVVPQLKQLMAQVDDNQREQDIQAQRLQNFAEALKSLIGSKDHNDTLIKRVVEQPELRAELGALIYAHQALNGNTVPEVFNSALSSQMVIQSAKELASFEPLSPKDMAALEAEDTSPGKAASAALKVRLTDRNAHKDSLTDKAKGQVLPDKGIARALTRQQALEEFVRSYHDEGLAYGALWKAAGQESKNSLHVRSIIEGSATQQADRLIAGTILRGQVLTDANCQSVVDSVRTLLKERREAVGELQKLLTDKYDAPELTYLKAQVESLEQAVGALNAMRPLDVFSKPESGELAKLGELIRECQPFQGKARSDIQNAYLKEQLAISRKALRWFDLKHFSQANGLFSKILFTIGGKKDRLNRVLAPQQSAKAVDIAKFTAQIARTNHEAVGLRAQADVLKSKLHELGELRNSLVNKSDTVMVALRLLAAQHLASKEGDPPRLGPQDLQVVKDQWESLVGPKLAANFPDAAQSLQLHYTGKDAKTLISGLGDEQRVKVTTQLQTLQQRDEEVRAGHDALRRAVNELAIQSAQQQPIERELKQLLVRAGLDTTAMAHIQTATQGLKDTDRLKAIQDQLVEWALLRQELSVDADTRPLVAKAVMLKRNIEAEVLARISNPGRKEAMSNLIQELESNLLESLGSSAPVTLPSIDTEQYRASYSLLNDLRGLANDLRGLAAKADTAVAKSASEFNPKPESRMKALIEAEISAFPEPRWKGLMQAEQQVMRLWADSGAGLFGPDEGQKSPAQWALLDRLAESRLILANICAPLADELQKDAEKIDTTKKRDDKKAQEKRRLMDAANKLRDRAKAHRQAALVGGAKIAQQVSTWTGSPDRLGESAMTFAKACWSTPDYWGRNRAGEGVLLPQDPRQVSPDHLDKMRSLEQVAFGNAMDLTTDQNANFMRNESLMGGFLQPAKR